VANERSSSENPPIHVVRREDDTWAVYREGNKKVSSVHDTREQAEKRGVLWPTRAAPSSLSTTNKTGFKNARSSARNPLNKIGPDRNLETFPLTGYSKRY
jgi:hypothetical protein